MGCTTSIEYETNEEKERKEVENEVNEEKVGEVVEDVLFTSKLQPINYKSYEVKLPLKSDQARIRLNNHMKLSKKDGVIITFSPSFDGDIPTTVYDNLEPLERNNLGIIMIQLLRAGILFVKKVCDQESTTDQGKKFIIFIHRCSLVEYRYIIYCNEVYSEPSDEARRRTIELYGLRGYKSANTIKKEVFEIAAYDDAEICSTKWFDL